MNVKNILRLSAIIFVAGMIAGCEEQIKNDVSVEPAFPEKVTENGLEAGASVTLSFVPNMDWSVSVPLESLRWFWIDRDGVVTDKVSGKGSEETVSVVVKVSPDVEYDKSRSCEVKMTMGDRTETIAVLTRKAAERTIVVFTAKYADGVFETDSDGTYSYNEEEAGSLDLAWSVPDADFRLPVMVDSNVEWTIECPDNIDVNLPESTAGLVEIVLTGESVEALTDAEIVFLNDGQEMTRLPVTLPSCAGVSVYEVQHEDGSFLYSEDGGYLYYEEPTEELTLIWPGTGFRTSVRVDSKCNWTLDLPEWLAADLPDRRAGVVDISMIGVPSAYPIEQETGVVAFRLGDEVLHELEVTIPGVGDHMDFSLKMSLTSLEFDPAGSFFTTAGYVEGPAFGSYTSTKGGRVLVVDTTGGRINEDQDWLSVKTVTNWDTSDGADVLQTLEFEVSAAENLSDERTAMIIFLPETVTASVEDIFDAGTIRDDYARYAVPVLQHGSDMEYVTMLSSEDEMASVGAQFKVSTNPRLKVDKTFGPTDYAYELVYTNKYASEKTHMSFFKKYDSYKIFNASKKDVTEVSQTDSLYWLKFIPASEENKGGVIEMDYGDVAITGYVAFYDGDNNTLAVIQCDYNPSINVKPDVVVEFTEMSQQYAAMTGASLEKLESGELFNLLYDGKTPMYSLKYTMEGMPLKIKIPGNVKKHTVNPNGYKYFFKVNNVVYDESFGPNDILSEVVTDDEGAVEIYMSRPDAVYLVSDKLELPEGVYISLIYFNDKSDNPVFCLVCTLDLSADGGL